MFKDFYAQHCWEGGGPGQTFRNTCKQYANKLICQIQNGLKARGGVQSFRRGKDYQCVMFSDLNPQRYPLWFEKARLYSQLLVSTETVPEVGTLHATSTPDTALSIAANGIDWGVSGMCSLLRPCSSDASDALPLTY